MIGDLGLENREYRQEDSKVEVTGFEAKYYDTLMNLITFGRYPKFIRKAIADIGLKPGEIRRRDGAQRPADAALRR